MHDDVKLLVILLIVLVIAAFGLVAFYFVAESDHYARADKLQNYLTTQGVDTISGKIASPSVIITVSKEEFLAKAVEVDVVYRQRGNFYVFDETNTIAFVYYVPEMGIIEG